MLARRRDHRRPAIRDRCDEPLAQQETLTLRSPLPMKERQTMRFLVIPALLTACAASGLAQTPDHVRTADQRSISASFWSNMAPSDHFDIANAVIGPATNKQAPFDQPDIPISSHDRLYTA